MGVVAAALWDILAKAANVAQMSGVHAAMLVAVGMSLLRIPESRRECAKLERCSRRLHALLQWPTGCGAALLCSEMGGPVLMALVDAAGLVDSYKKSTLWHRVRRGRCMAAQLRDMQDVVDSYCGLLLYVNAHLLLQPATRRPPSDATTYGIHEVNENEPSQTVTNSPGAAETRGTRRPDDDGEGSNIGSRTGDTGPAGRERSATA
ncbi:protein mid1-complementing activity 2-like [Hordeum vulgare]|nr:protein mid1-complementing activity 2-like [Hordeum vulgare]